MRRSLIIKKALELRPENADAHANLGSVFLAKGRVRDAIAEYRDALRIAPENVACPEQSGMAAGDMLPNHRSEMDQRPCFSLNWPNQKALGRENRPIVLRILAAAYAESGRFAEAKKAARTGIARGRDPREFQFVQCSPG